MRLDDVCCPIPPEIVVRCLNVSFRILKSSFITAFFYRFPLELSCFLGSEKLLTGKSSRTLQRCDAVVVPNALEVWVTPCRVRRCRRLLRRCLGYLSGGEHHRSKAGNSRQKYGPLAHHRCPPISEAYINRQFRVSINVKWSVNNEQCKCSCSIAFRIEHCAITSTSFIVHGPFVSYMTGFLRDWYTLRPHLRLRTF